MTEKRNPYEPGPIAAGVDYWAFKAVWVTENGILVEVSYRWPRHSERPDSELYAAIDRYLHHEAGTTRVHYRQLVAKENFRPRRKRAAA